MTEIWTQAALRLGLALLSSLPSNYPDRGVEVEREPSQG